MSEGDKNETRLAELEQQVRRQADKRGWLDLGLSFAVRVPRAAFERWALSGAGAEHLAGEWIIVNRLREPRDAYLADWLLGAGLPEGALQLYPELQAAAQARAEMIRQEKLAFSFTRLTGRGFAHGCVTEAVPGCPAPVGAMLLVRQPQAEHALAALTAGMNGGGAVIAEQDGPLTDMVRASNEVLPLLSDDHRAKLSANLGRLADVRVLAIEGATQKFRKGMEISVDLDSGRGRILERAPGPRIVELSQWRDRRRDVKPTLG